MAHNQFRRGKHIYGFIGLTLLFVFLFYATDIYSQEKDWRNIENAVAIIPDEGYCDQPYSVINSKGEWVVVLTTGAGREGQPGQHVVSTISKDKGKTWSPLIDIEPATGPEASWITPLIIPSGRIYVFYTYNSENRREVLNSSGVPIKRVDTFGKMMMKYSDDGGYSWSEKHYEVPARNFEIDDKNIYKGKIQFFWSVALPIVHENAVYFPLSKVGNFGEGFMESGSGAILKSSNILFEKDPEKIEWETLPDGNKGLLPPQGQVADEHNIVSLSDGSLYCVYRTNQGHNAQVYSRDNGHTWTTPEWASYSPGGKLMKQPRCFNKIYKFSNGKYAMFFHNNSSRNYSSHPLGNRNPTWLAGGIEKDGYIYWSQPEVFLYDMDYFNGISYPDWIEDNGEYYFTETQKTIARIHKIPAEYLEMLWNQALNKEMTKEGLALELEGESCEQGSEFTMPGIGNLYKGDGFSLEFKLKTGNLKKDQLLLDTRREKTEGYQNAAKYIGNGLKISILKSGALEFLMDDGRTPLIWSTAPGVIIPKAVNHIVINVDAKSKMLTFVINGDLWDGGERPFGYARFNPFMWDVNGDPKVRFSSEFKGNIELFRVYNRFLYTSESIANYRSGQ
ncbi:sialidase family protein [Maribellus comscasis]|nr:exo-alpha-sialidase [Maribellus comscasis]